MYCSTVNSVMHTHVSIPPPVTSLVIIPTMTDYLHNCMTPSPWCACTAVPLIMECDNELNTKFPNPFIVLNKWSVFLIWCFRPMPNGLVNPGILIFRALKIRRTHLLIVSAADAKQTYCYLRTLRQIIKTHATSCVDIQRTDLASSRQYCAMPRMWVTSMHNCFQPATSRSAKICRQGMPDHFFSSEKSQIQQKYGRHCHPNTLFWPWHRHRLSPSKFMMRRRRGGDSSFGMGSRGPRGLSGTRSTGKLSLQPHWQIKQSKEDLVIMFSFESFHWCHQFSTQPV